MSEIWMATKREFYKTMWAGLLDGKRFIEIRKLVNKGESKAAKAEFHNDLDGFLEAAKKQQKGVDHYFGAHLRDTPDGTRDAVSRVTTLHADLDYKDRPFAEWQQKLKDFNPQVTVVIETGHGIHGYWFLEKPVHLKSEVEKAHFEGVQKALQQALGADSTHDLPRILRIPGTVNYKDLEKPKQCSILFADLTRKYRLAQFAKFKPVENTNEPKDKPLAPAVKDEIIEGGRNQALASLAGSIRRPGMTGEEIEAALLVANQKRCQPPLPDAEVRKIARSVGRYEPAPQSDLNRVPDLEFLRVSQITPRFVDFLWYPYIPKGKITLIDGDPGVGKSWLTQALATGVSCGHGIPRRIEQAESVLFLAGEDGPEDTVRPRLDNMGADLEKIYLVPEVFVLNHRSLQAFHRLIEQTRPALVVIDPLVAYMGRGLDMNAANETRSLMAPLAEMATKFNCALVCVRHLRKSGGKRIYQGLGSIDMVGAARSVLHVSFDPEMPLMRVIRHVKCNVAQTGHKVFYHLREGMFFWGDEGLEGGSDE